MLQECFVEHRHRGAVRNRHLRSNERVVLDGAVGPGNDFSPRPGGRKSKNPRLAGRLMPS